MKASKCVVRSLALQFTDRQHRSGQARENQQSRSDCADKFKDGGVYRGRTPHTRYVRHMSTTRELLANIWPTALDSTYPEYDGGAPSSAATLVCGGLVGGVQGVQVTRLVFARGERSRTVVNFAVVLPRAWSARAWSGSAGGAGCINFVQHAKKVAEARLRDCGISALCALASGAEVVQLAMRIFLTLSLKQCN